MPIYIEVRSTQKRGKEYLFIFKRALICSNLKFYESFLPFLVASVGNFPHLFQIFHENQFGLHGLLRAENSLWKVTRVEEALEFIGELLVGEKSAQAGNSKVFVLKSLNCLDFLRGELLYRGQKFYSGHDLALEVLDDVLRLIPVSLYASASQA